jgi:hypothetical protein
MNVFLFQIEIADKLLREEKQLKKRYQQQPQLWPEKQRDRNKVVVFSSEKYAIFQSNRLAFFSFSCFLFLPIASFCITLNTMMCFLSVSIEVWTSKDEAKVVKSL